MQANTTWLCVVPSLPKNCFKSFRMGGKRQWSSKGMIQADLIRVNQGMICKILNAFDMYICSSGCFRGIYILTCQVFSESPSFTNQTPTFLSCLWSSGTPYLSAWKLQSPSNPHCDIKRAIIYNNTNNKKVLRKFKKKKNPISKTPAAVFCA